MSPSICARAVLGSPSRRLTAALAAGLYIVLSGGEVRGGNPVYWDTTGSSWSSAASWSTAPNTNTPDPSPNPPNLANNDNAVFRTSSGAALNLAQNVNLNANQSALTLVTNANNQATTTLLGGGTDRVLTLGAGGINHLGGGLTLGSNTVGQKVDVNLQDSQSWIGSSSGTGAAGINVLNNVSIASTANRTLTLTGTGSGNVIAGNISDGTHVLSLAKTGGGDWTLSGANSFTGTTAVNLGTLKLNYATQNNSKLADGAALSFGGGTVELAGGSHADAVASTTLNAGSSTVTRSSGTSVLRLGAITRNTAGTIDFAAGSIASTSSANDASGILGPWATVGGADFATRSASVENGANNFITAFTGYTDVTRLASGTKAISNSATANVRIIEGSGIVGDITLGAATTAINTLNQASTGGTTTINPATGQTLRVNTILVGPTANALTIEAVANDSTLTTATASGNLTVINNSLVNTVTINSTIADNGAGSSLVNAGPGIVALGGTNTYTGKTFLNDGVLRITSDAGLGTAPGAAVADQLTFNGGRLHLNAAVTLNANRGITLNAPGGTIDTAATFVSTYAGVVTGSGELTKVGQGELTLSGTNTIAGGTTVTAGILRLNFATLNTTKLADAAALTLGGAATVELAGGSHVEAVGSTTLSPGSVSVTRSSGTSVLQMNGINRRVGSNINFGAASIAQTDLSNTATSILGGWATVGGTDWAVSSGAAADTNITALGAYTNDVWAAGNNTTIVTAATAPASGSTTNSLRFNTAAANTVTLTGTNTITSGGILLTSTLAGNTTTITGGTLRGAAGADLVVNQFNTGTLTIASAIADNTTATGLTKSGTGVLRLTSANSYTGVTTISRGTLEITNNTALGGSAAGQHTTILGNDGGTSTQLRLDAATSDLTIAEPINLWGTTAGRATITNNSAQNHVFNGAIDVSSDTNLVQISSNALGSITVNGDINGTMTNGAILLLRGGSPSSQNRILGNVNITGGNLGITDTAVWRIGAAGKTYNWNNTQVSAGTLIMLTSGVLPASNQIILGQGSNAANATLDLNNTNQTTTGIVFNLNGTATTVLGVLSTGTGALTLNGDVTFNTVNTYTATGSNISGNVNLGGGVRTFTINDSTGTATELTVSAAVSNGGLLKAGAGTMVLSGANTYAGTTTVDDGILLVSNASALGTAAGGTIINSALTASPTLRLANGITVASEPLTMNSSTAGDRRSTLDNAAGSTSTWNGPISLTGNGLSQMVAGGTLTIGGAITGSTGTLVLRGLGSGTLSSTATVNITGDLGKTDGGTWTINSTGNNWGLTRLNAGTLKNGVTNALDTGAVLSLGQSGNANVGTYDLSGFSQTVAGLEIEAGSTAPAASQTVTNTGGAAGTLTVNNATDYTYAGTITNGANALSLLKTGAGTLTLSGANSFTGTVTVDTGILLVGNATALGTAAGGTIINNALTSSPTVRLANGITVASEPLTMNSATAGDRRATLDNAAGSTSTWNGPISLTGDGLATITAGGTMTIGGAVTGTTGLFLLRGAGTGTLSSTATVNITGNLGKTDGGTWTINSTGNNWGLTRVSAGTLRNGVSNALDTSAVLSLGQAASPNVGRYDLNGFNQTIAGLEIEAGSTAPAASQTVTNAGAAAGTLTIDNTTDHVYAGTITNGASALSLVKEGAGKQTLSGSNSFTGNVTVNNGVLNLQNSNALGTAAKIVTAATQTGEIQLQGGITIPAALTFRTSNNSAVDGFVALRNFSGNNAINGNIELVAGAGGSVYASDAGQLTLAGNISATATLRTLEFTGAGNFVASGAISDGTTVNLPVTKSGTGMLTYSGASANTYTGVTTVSGGTLQLQKTAGTNAIAGNVTLGDAVGNDVLLLAANNQIVDTSILSFNGSGANAGIFRMNGFTDTVGGISSNTAGAGIVENNHAATASTLNLDLAIGDTKTFSGIIRDGSGGALGITKVGQNSGFTILSGTGTQVLSGANTYTGVTNVNWGVIRIENASALGSTSGNTVVAGNAILHSPSLDLAGGIVFNPEPLTLIGRPPGSGFFFFDGHLRNALGDNTWTGPITLATSIAANSHFRLESQAGTFTINGGATTAIASGNVDLHLQGASNGIISTNAFNFMAGATNTLHKDGAGHWTVATPFNNLDTVIVNNGTLELTNGGSFGPPTAINVGTTIFNTATLRLTKNDVPYTLVNGDLSVGTNQAVSAGVVNHMTGDVTVNGNVILSAINDSKGVYNISAGSLTLPSGKQLVVGNAGYNAVPDVPTAILLQAELNISGTGIVSAPEVIVAKGTGTLQNSRGTINISSGTLNAGDLKVGDVGHGTLNQTGGTINVTNPTTYSLGAGGGTSLVNQSAGATNVTGGMVIGDGVGAAGDNVYNLSGGVLDFGDTAGAPSHHAAGTAPSALTINSDGTFNFTGGTLQDVTTIATPGGAGTFVQNGGNFVIGQEEADGNSPDNIARVTTINGGYSLLAGALKLDAFGPDLTPDECCDGVPSPNDLLSVEGAALLDSEVNLNLVGYDPEFGDAITLLCAESIELGDDFVLAGGFFRIVETGSEEFPFALQAIVPEPASVALWMLVGFAVVAFALKGHALKRRALAPARLPGW